MTSRLTDARGVDVISSSDRGLQYGDGLFETIAIRDGEARLWSCHMERLAIGCQLLNINMPGEALLRDGVAQALAGSDATPDFAVVKIVVTAGAGTRGYGRAAADEPTVLFGAYPSQPVPRDWYSGGLEVMICNTRLASGSPFAGLKTLNRLEQVMARSEVEAAGLFEGLTMDADGNVICGTMSNVFFVHDNLLSTPPLEGCGVAGIMRRHLIECLADSGIDVRRQSLGLVEALQSDEVFLCNSQFGIIPVAKCGNRTWSAGRATRAAMALLAAHGVPECSP